MGTTEARPFPTDEQIKLLFVSTLDAWGKVEHAMLKLFYIFLKPLKFSTATTVYHSINSFQSQREAISALSETIINDETIRTKIDSLMGRARSLATKRNRLVHGRWRHAERHRKGIKYRLIFRIYFHANTNLWAPQDFRGTRAMKGTTHFFHDDITRCQNEFTALAADITDALSIVAAHLSVSPHIEIPIEEVTELKIQTNQP